ncbi:restriction endonuclease [Geitlerinema sp. P-1104]|uniref:restriction endonuclease n=1 Tax=Geitlerinema sp. P-1104 TaxID=2546230 RepID=UPI0014772C59|nr:restriction endonuclease [Geitlerinema sp. P-1104]NMG60385.1 restriction endonuclease [Geitlerinema sp. P-1104]
MSNSPIQKILFGSPGTGKSYQIHKYIISEELKVNDQEQNVITTVFHPEYTYGDFVGKLMPRTDDDGRVEYKFYPGHFLKALSRAYRNIIDSWIQLKKDQENVRDNYKKELGKNLDDFSAEERQELKQRKEKVERKVENVVLVVDELNRGNSAAIFGSVFQLLDREKKGWSQYSITMSDLEIFGLLNSMTFRRYNLEGESVFYYNGNVCKATIYNKYLKEYISERDPEIQGKNEVNLLENRIKIPPNLSIIATMNTSDNSIYFMDSAFKRRWDWEFVNIDDVQQREQVASRKVILYGHEICAWYKLVDHLNKFIRLNYKVVRKIEDKQVGYFFLNEGTITEASIKNKLMFFIWDSVFPNNRKPLAELLNLREEELVTFGQFTKPEIVKKFVTKILEV